MGEVYSVERVALTDVKALMAIERLPGYDALVGRWEEDKHRAEIADPANLYLALREAGELAGFAIVLGLDDPNCRAHLKRIAVADAGPRRRRAAAARPDRPCLHRDRNQPARSRRVRRQRAGQARL